MDYFCVHHIQDLPTDYKPLSNLPFTFVDNSVQQRQVALIHSGTLIFKTVIYYYSSAAVSPGNLLDLQNLRPKQDLLNQRPDPPAIPIHSKV